MIVPVILCGGAGTRLWPLSREHQPKQLLPLVSERTMLEETLLRLQALAPEASPILVCGEAHRFAVAEQARRCGVTPAAILLEPQGRGTAPAATLAALVARELPRKPHDEDPVLFVAPADHHIADASGFHRAAAEGIARAAGGKLSIFGVPARSPETGYGYIRCHPGPGPAYRVDRFVEKPDRKRAETYVAGGNYWWNSGMFVFQAGTWLDEMERRAPDIVRSCEAALRSAARDLDFVRLPSPFLCRSDSIDCAVMEKTRDALLVPLDAGWNDVGSWASLADCLPVDAQGNAKRGDVVLQDSRGCCIIAQSRMVAAVGLDDHVVVETPDAVLVVPKDRVQSVKALVDQLRAAGREEASTHRMVFRPWGSYDTLDTGERFKVKRLTVQPGAALSLQLHTRRAEHWVVVSGTARVTRGDDVFELHQDQSTYIPVGVRHRIENPGTELLELIEVQSGAYTGEDDIVRLQDTYGRAVEAA